MSSVSLQPLLTKKAIIPQEFWPSYHNIAMGIADLFGGMKNLEKIPVFPLEDLRGNIVEVREGVVNTSKVKKLDYPIAFFFDNEGVYTGITLAYRIKSIQMPKFSCFRGYVKREIEIIYIGPTEKDSLSKLSINSVVSKFGPASTLHSQRESLSENECTPLLEMLFNGESYQVQLQSTASCLYTQQARIELDQDE